MGNPFRAPDTEPTETARVAGSTRRAGEPAGTDHPHDGCVCPDSGAISTPESSRRTDPDRNARRPTDPGIPACPTRFAVFIAEGVATTYRLPEKGTVTVGRSPRADLTVSHPSMSRVHARLHLGDELHVEDLGSSNGTCIGHVALEPSVPHPVAMGAVIDLGSVMMTVQYGERSERPRRVVAHGYFEMRVEEECNRRGPADRRFAVLRVRAEGEVSHDLVREALAVMLRPADMIAAYSPEEYEILLLDCSPTVAREIELRARDTLARHCTSVPTGLALFPQDGRSPEELLAAVDASIRGDKDNGPVVADDVVVADDAMARLYALGERVAPSTLAVLLVGETGVGKEVMASHVQRCSDRAAAPFLRLNCAALNETLLESELFGFERGAFTDAVHGKAGLLESADGGTVFLDELCELPAGLQAKLLEVVEEKRVRRVGGVTPRAADVRFIVATNCNVERAIATGRFRRDLYYRLAGITINIPPLRDRPGEIEPLARRFVRDASARAGLELPAISAAALEMLVAYPWPGNIRELRNVIERALILSAGAPILAAHLPGEKMTGVVDVAHSPPCQPPVLPARAEPPPPRPIDELETPTEQPSSGLLHQVERLERQRIVDALATCGGNQSAAARALGLSRGALLRRIKRYGI